MDEVLERIVQRACREQVVASRTMESGMQLLSYPMTGAVLVGVGFGRERASMTKLDEVLRRRAESPERFGAWLPALLADGSWYVVRRAPNLNPGTDGAAPILPPAELAAAKELLA